MTTVAKGQPCTLSSLMENAPELQCLTEGECLWLLWASTFECWPKWFQEMVDDSDRVICGLCHARIFCGPEVGTGRLQAGLIYHGRSHIHQAHVPTATLKALESLAVLCGDEKQACRQILGIRRRRWR